jgi:hypothetical protein
LRGKRRRLEAALRKRFLNKKGRVMIYIGNFLHTTNQEQRQEMDRRHGEFTLIVESTDAETALHLFREKLLAYQRVRDFFQGECSIFLTQFYELKTFPKKEALMLSYSSYAGDPAMPFIGCTLPSAMSDECRIYEWNENEPHIDGLKGKPFVEFKS